MATVKFPLKVYYDGSCTVCRSEMVHYRERDRAGRLELIDISAAVFEPDPTGFSREELMARLHVIDADGGVHTGVAAFQAIWQAFPESLLLGLASAIIGLPLVNPLARLGYACFARLRRFLPQTGPDCSNDHCRLHH